MEVRKYRRKCFWQKVGNIAPPISLQAVLECAEALSVKVSLGTLTPALSEQAEEWLITNSALEVVPVVRIAATRLEEKRFAGPGAATARLMAAYRELVMSETRPR